MIVVDLYSRTPIYKQIEEQILLKINSKEYKAGDKLPSIRELSSSLGLNVNTVKRAFNELEMKGVTYSVQGSGIFVSDNPNGNEAMHTEASQEIRKAILSAKAKGMAKEEIINILKEEYEGN